MLTTVASAPDDLISKVQFAPTSNHVLVSSWDQTLRVYETSLLTSVSFRAPLLDCCWDSHSSCTVYTTGIEPTIYHVDLNTGQKTAIGDPQDRPVKSLLYHEGTRSLISGSWDRTLQQMDPRASERFLRTNLPGKVFAMDSVDNYLVVAMADREVYVFDVRNIQEPFQRRESSLKYPTRTVRCMPDGVGYASSSIEGRVAVELFDPSPEVQAMKYAFKCHRIVDRNSNTDIVTPINSLAFHPTNATFFTAGSDCSVSLWDYKAKKRLKQYQPLVHSVVSIDVSHDGTLLAMGTSDDTYKENPLELGMKKAQSQLYLRQLQEGR
jgi:cell cycle arrest protein BUB3